MVNNLASVVELDDVNIVAGVDEDTNDVEINGDGDDECTDADDEDVVSDGGSADDAVPDDLRDVADVKVEDDRDTDGVKRGGDADSERNDGFDDTDNDVCTSSDDCTDDCVDSDVMGKPDSDRDVDVEAASVDVVIFTLTDIDDNLKTAEADNTRIALDDDWDPVKDTGLDAALEGNGDVETNDGGFFDSSGNEVDRAAEDFIDVGADFDNEVETDSNTETTDIVDSGVAAKFNEENEFDTDIKAELCVDLDADANGPAGSDVAKDFVDVATDSKDDNDTDPDIEAVGVSDSIGDDTCVNVNIAVDADVHFDSDVGTNSDEDSVGVVDSKDVEETDVNRTTDGNVVPVYELGSNSDEVGDEGDTNPCFEVVGNTDFDRVSEADADINTDVDLDIETDRDTDCDNVDDVEIASCPGE